MNPCYFCDGPLQMDREQGWFDSCKFYVNAPWEPRLDDAMSRRMAAAEEVKELERMFDIVLDKT